MSARAGELGLSARDRRVVEQLVAEQQARERTPHKDELGGFGLKSPTADLEQQIAGVNAEIEALKGTIDDLNSQLEKSKQADREATKAQKEIPKAVETTKNALEELRSKTQAQTQTTNEAQAAQERTKQTLDNVSAAGDKAADALNKVAKSAPDKAKQAKDRKRLTGGDEEEGEKESKTIAGVKRAWAETKRLAKDTLSDWASGVGSIVENYVLLGETGPAALKKVTAQAIASLAAQATTHAAFELGMGFATLFTNPAESAGHFAAAGIFAGIAAGATFGGRALAGDSFKDKGASAGGGGGRAYGETPHTLPTNQATPSGAAYGSAAGASSQQQSHVEVLHMVADAIHQNTAALNRLKGIPKGQVVEQGLRENPQAAGRALLRSMDSNAGITDGISRRQNTE
jgi:predicted  nucleic acid-binding Zn-ribbon protein